jgi:hypothetical protein
MGRSWWFVEQPVLDTDGSTQLAWDNLLAVIAAVDEDYRRRACRATEATYGRERRWSNRTVRHAAGSAKAYRPRRRGAGAGSEVGAIPA